MYLEDRIAALESRVKDLEAELGLPPFDGTALARRTYEVIRALASAGGISTETILGRGRAAETVWLRHLAIHLVWRLTGASQPALGEAFGMDHTSIGYALASVRERLELEPERQKEVEDWVKRLERKRRNDENTR